MSQTSIFSSPVQQFFDNNGVPLVGGMLYFYSVGTMIPKVVYSDSSGTTVLSNPVILDSAGRTSVWLSGYYYVVLTDALGNQIWSEDNVSSQYNLSLVTLEWLLQMDVLSYINSTDFSVPGDVTNVYQIGRRIQCVVSAGTIYGIILTAVVSGAPFITTVTVIWDSGALDSGLSTASLGILSVSSPSIPTLPVNIFTHSSNTANYTFLETDLNKIFQVEFTAGLYTSAVCTLLDPTAVPSGSWMWIQNRGLDGASGAPIIFNGTINGVANMIISPLDEIFIWSDGRTWQSKTSKTVVTCVNTSNIAYSALPLYAPLVAWGAANNSSETTVMTAMPCYGFIKNLSTRAITNTFAYNTASVTLRKNGSNSTLVCSIYNANTFCNDLFINLAPTSPHVIPFNQGDLLDYLITTTANSGAMQNLTISAEVITY